MTLEVIKNVAGGRAGELDPMLAELQTRRRVEHHDRAVGSLADEHAELGLSPEVPVNVERRDRDQIRVALWRFGELRQLGIDCGQLGLEVCGSFDLGGIENCLYPTRLGRLVRAVETLTGDDEDALVGRRQCGGSAGPEVKPLAPFDSCSSVGAELGGQVRHRHRKRVPVKVAAGGFGLT